MYQSEFPVEQPVPVFDPTLVFLLILAGIAIAALAFFAGRLTGRGEKGEKTSDVPKKIHEAIKAKCVAASSAHSGELEKKAHELLAEVDRLIGPLLTFGGPCAKAFQHLSDAIDGKPPEEKPKEAAKDGHPGAAHGKDDKHGDDKVCAEHGHDKHKCDDKCRGGGVEVLSRNVTIVGSQTVLLASCKPEAKHEDHGGPKGPDSKEFKQLLRLAVAEFADFWNRPNCLRELEDCQKSLTTLPPMPKEKPHGADHH
ncbi:hypothetical protein [Caulobacter sp. 602-1]|uniref:hypothetical protein n=1 Tax=unclassified Caulobacter TaxID=2648921 RepID=UPI001F328F2B|nr:hypothetical protein [Caulobacter sp. 602-1]